MRMTIDAAQSQPSFNVMDDNGVIKAKVYLCTNGAVIKTEKGNFMLPMGIRNVEAQVGKVIEVPLTDGVEIYNEREDL